MWRSADDKLMPVCLCDFQETCISERVALTPGPKIPNNLGLSKLVDFSHMTELKWGLFREVQE